MPPLHYLRAAGPDAQHKPAMPEMFCRLMADMASIAGVRAPSCAMPVARRIRSVLAAIAARA